MHITIFVIQQLRESGDACILNNAKLSSRHCGLLSIMQATSATGCSGRQRSPAGLFAIPTVSLGQHPAAGQDCTSPLSFDDFILTAALAAMMNKRRELLGVDVHQMHPDSLPASAQLQFLAGSWQKIPVVGLPAPASPVG